MNPKLQVKLSAIIATVTGIITYLATLPPEQQDTVTGPIVALIPLTWRPEVGLIAKAVMSVTTFWAIFKASHTGASDPVTPPAPPASTMPPKGSALI